jgi:UDP-N-acetyl-D-mannosaminuronic acid dehydrogenase
MKLGGIDVREELINRIRGRTACIAVIGLGRVGLPVAAVLADLGYRVMGVDIRKEVVEAISSLGIRTREPGLDELIKKVIETGKLEVTTNDLEAVRAADLVIICVQTPITENIEPNLTYLRMACETIARCLSKGKLVIVESTVPPGTTKNLVARILEKSGLKCGKDFWFAYCPERITSGKAIHELIKNVRIAGGFDKESGDIAAELLKVMTKGGVISTDYLSAEIAKLAENAFRDVNVAFANELALICEQVGADVAEVIKIANTHPRVSIHNPGCGVGGPCLTKDPRLLLYSAKEKGLLPKIIRFSRELNDYMPEHTVKLLAQALKEAGKHVENSKIAIFGVAYKGGVDDASNSPAEVIIRKLIGLGARVVVYDPYCKENFGVEKALNVTKAVRGKDCIVIATDHKPFEDLNLKRIKTLMNEKPVIIDGRRIIDATEAKKQGFTYFGIGYGT